MSRGETRDTLWSSKLSHSDFSGSFWEGVEEEEDEEEEEGGFEGDLAWCPRLMSQV